MSETEVFMPGKTLHVMYFAVGVMGQQFNDAPSDDYKEQIRKVEGLLDGVLLTVKGHWHTGDVHKTICPPDDDVELNTFIQSKLCKPMSAHIDMVYSVVNSVLVERRQQRRKGTDT